MSTTDPDNKDIEASDNEFKGVCYTGIALIAFLIMIAGFIVFLIVG